MLAWRFNSREFDNIKRLLPSSKWSLHRLTALFGLTRPSFWGEMEAIIYELGYICWVIERGECFVKSMIVFARLKMNIWFEYDFREISVMLHFNLRASNGALTLMNFFIGNCGMEGCKGAGPATLARLAMLSCSTTPSPPPLAFRLQPPTTSHPHPIFLKSSPNSLSSFHFKTKSTKFNKLNLLIYFDVSECINFTIFLTVPHKFWPW